jgi:uncharacterized membrane protein YhaH (DUF805 family)
VGIIFGFIASMLIMFLMVRFLNSTVDLITFYIFCFICLFAILFSISCLVARRLHDVNINGIYFVIFTIPCFISIAFGGQYNNDYATALYTVSMYLLIIEWLFLVLFPGTKGPNKYGS